MNIAVKDIMATDIAFVTSCTTLKEAAKKMEECSCGFLPVGSKEKVVGVITDRDIVIRAVSSGRDASNECVRDYMTTSVIGCNENDALEDAVKKMHLNNVSRLVVRNKSGDVVGVLSLGEYLSRFSKASEVVSLVKHTFGAMAA